MVAMVVFGASCSHDPDPISMSATNPTISALADVVVNDLTINENFTLTWSVARFDGVNQSDVTYTITAKTDTGASVELGTTSDLFYTCTYAELLEMLGVKYTGNYNVTFEVTANAPNGESKASTPTAIKLEFTKVTYMWILGDYQGWDPDAPASRLFQGEDGIFRGFVQLESDGGFKFTSQKGWEGTNFGAGANAGELSSDGGAGNISATTGLYYVEADTEAMTYALVPLTNVSLIGEAVGGWSVDVPMNYDATNKVWTAIADVVEGKEYKVRFNNDWSVSHNGKQYDCSLGGELTNLKFAGSNLSAESGGITGFTLSLFDYDYNMTLGEIQEDLTKLYVANSGNSWNYLSTPILNVLNDASGASTNCYAGIADFTGVATQVLLARMQTPLGTQFGGSASSLTEYAGGTATTPISLNAGAKLLFADLNAGFMSFSEVNITSIALIGAFNGWNVATATPLVRNASGKWEAAETFAADGEFKLIINGQWNTTINGTEVQMSLGGSCTDLTLSGGNLTISEGSHTFALDFMTSPVTLAIDGKVQDIELNPDFLEVTGAFGGYNWNLGAASPALYPYKESGRYASFVDMYKPAASTDTEAGFKITYPNWASWFGGALPTGTTYTFDVGTSDDNLSIPFGLYFWDITFDASAKTGVATATPIVSVNLIGGISGTGWGQDFPMTSAGEGIYTMDAAIDGEFKVRMHEAGFTDSTAWLYNLGNSVDANLTLGTDTALTPDAGNIKLPAGNYTITVNLGVSPNTIKAVAK